MPHRPLPPPVAAVLTACLLAAAPGVVGSCRGADAWACAGEDHRPVLPEDANDCHVAYELLVRANECMEGFYDDEFKKGMNGRNGQLAYYFALADHATAEQQAECAAQAVTYQQTIDDPECAAPSTDCGPPPGGDNVCHTYFAAMLEVRERCEPDSFGEGINGADAAWDASMAMADYASDDEQAGTCASGLSYWQSYNDGGTCP